MYEDCLFYFNVRRKTVSFKSRASVWVKVVLPVTSSRSIFKLENKFFLTSFPIGNTRFVKNLDPCIPFFKFGPIWSSVGPCIPLLEIRTESAVRRSLHSLYKFGQFSGSSILPSSFKNLDLFGRPWIPASPLPVKIRIDLAVHGSLHPRPRNPCYVRGWLIISHCSRY